MFRVLRHPNTPIFCVVFLLLLATILVWQAVFRLQNSTLRVTFLDVGQGDAIFVEAPGGRQMLIDGGPDRSVLRELGNVLPFYDRSIDVVVGTHPDKDHIFGLVPVLERYTVSHIIDPNVSNDTSFWEAFAEAKDGEPAEHYIARRDMVVHLGRGVDFHILFPDRDLPGLSDTNTASIVGKLTFGNTAFLLTGDSPKSIEAYLVSLDGKNLKSDVLKAGHHGSRTSSSEEFLEAVAPLYAVISAGKDNSYGHPHEEVTERFQKIGARILGTYENSAIRFVSDGAVLRVK